LPFFLVTRSFLSAVRDLPRRHTGLEDRFLVGMALVACTTFVYASAQVGPKAGFTAMLEGLLGTGLAFIVVVEQLGGRSTR
jgi:hypothetical protein